MDRCPICWEDMTQNNSYCISVCKHRFHGYCLRKWFCFKDPRGPFQLNHRQRRLSAPCPMCRRQIILCMIHLRRFPPPGVEAEWKKSNRTLSFNKRLMRFFCCTHTVIRSDEA